MLKNLPAHWDEETDLIAIGSGLGGLAAAITARGLGAEALVLERSDLLGGVGALSMGEIWIAGNRHAQALGIADSPARGFRYLKRLAMGYADETAMLNQVIHGPVALEHFAARIGLKTCLVRNYPDYYYGHVEDAVAEGRLLEVEPFAAAQLGPWQARTRVSPLLPYGMTHADMYERGGPANVKHWDMALMGQRLAADQRCLGPGLAASFVKGALDCGVKLRTGAEVLELISDGTRIAGVRAVIGGRLRAIRAHRGVVIAVGGYERNNDYNKTLNNQLDLESMLFASIDGAHFRLAGPLGARIARVPEMTALGFHVPGEEQISGEPLWRNCQAPVALPHSIVVNRRGERFGNESFYRSLLFMVDVIDGATQTHPNFPCWAIFDSQARAKYPFGSMPPGQDLPEGMGAKAHGLAELGALIGIDAHGLEATVARFNEGCARGEDPQFKRGSHAWSAWTFGDPFNAPHPNLGALAQAPFYAVPLHRVGFSGIPAAGLLADHHCRVIGWDDRPIAGLYAAGNSVARTDAGAAMQSGLANARGMTHGYLAGRHAAGAGSELLQQALAGLAA